MTLNCRYVYRAPFEVPDIAKKYGNLTLTYAAQLHFAVMEIDRETLQPKILAYAAVDDCGRAINPRIVEGQVHGATAHGIGAAFMENCAMMRKGICWPARSATTRRSLSPTCPISLTGTSESPSPFSYNGAKGMGEGGAAPVHTVCAALQDAVVPRGILIDDSHNTGSSLFEASQIAAPGSGLSSSAGGKPRDKVTGRLFAL